MPRFLTAAFFVAVLAWPARADNVEIELAELAKDVAKVLDKENQKVVKLGRFTGAGPLPSNFGPEIQRLLHQEFQRLKIGVDKDALIEIAGTYRPADEDPSAPALKEMFVRINAQLVNSKSGLPLNNVSVLSRAVYGNTELTKVFAPNVSLPPNADRKQRNDDIKPRITQPDCHVQGGRVCSKPGSPFAVELLVVDKADAPAPRDGREARKQDGLAFVPIQRGEFYRVRITNTAPFDVAVKLSIDGLDQYVFTNPAMEIEEDGKTVVKKLRDPKTGSPIYNYRIIPQGKAAVIGGWFRDLKNFDYFVVTEFSQSEVGKLLKPATDDVGQVVVQFFACWEKDADKPTDETTNDKSAGPDATGRIPGGKQILVEKTVTVGALRDTVSIRYNRDGK